MPKVNRIDIPLNVVIRITKRESEYSERAKLILTAEDGREFDLFYDDGNGYSRDLIVGDVEPSKSDA